MEIVQDDEEIAIDAIPLATKPLIIVEYKIVKEGQKGFYHLIRADGSSNRYSSMIRMLQNISREDLETLWKLVKTKHGNTRPEDVYEKVLWGDLKVMFELDIKSEIWRSLQGYKVTVWNLFDSSRVHFVRFKNLHIFMLVEKRYPLTPITITNMLNKKLQADYWIRCAINYSSSCIAGTKPIPLVADETVHNEKWRQCERACHYCLLACAVIMVVGNINRTQSTAIPNDPFPLGGLVLDGSTGAKIPYLGDRLLKLEEGQELERRKVRTLTTQELRLFRRSKSSLHNHKKIKGVYVLMTPSEPTTTSRPQSQILVKDKGKGIMQELGKPVKVKGKDQIEYDANAEEQGEISIEEISRLFVELMDKGRKLLQTLRMLFEKEMKRVNIFVDIDAKLVKGRETREQSGSKRAGDELEQESSKRQKTKDGYTRPKETYERVLWGDLKVMFEPHVEDNIWRNLQGQKILLWKLYDSCRIHFLRFENMHIYMLVEKRYPLLPTTITDMLNRKLQVDYWNETCTGYSLKDKNEAKLDKTESGIGKGAAEKTKAKVQKGLKTELKTDIFRIGLDNFYAFNGSQERSQSQTGYGIRKGIEKRNPELPIMINM
ncbi:hypothetical protein Tco_0053154 [Tanacetum coccineum]